MMTPFASQQISVLGIARSGVAAANVLVQEYGVPVCISDTKDRAALEKFLEKLDPRVKVVTGQNDLAYSDLAIVSPGIPPQAQLFKDMAARQIPVIAEIELAFLISKAPIVAISGTNGKSTCTVLTGHLFANSSRYREKTFVGGNIGNPLCDGITRVPADGVVVAEISCFQLMHIREFRPRVTLFLNIQEDHIDYHGSMANYIAAKKRIFQNQQGSDIAVLNADDPVVSAWSSEISAKSYFFSTRKPLAKGFYIDKGDLVVNLAGWPEKISSIADLPKSLLGRHNHENALGAIAGCYLSGMPLNEIQAALKTFMGLADRIEFVREKMGVSYFNDSKGTNPNSTAVAIETFKGRPVILLLGGLGKGLDFTFLATDYLDTIRQAICFGEAGPEIYETFKPRLPSTLVKGMKQALYLADDMAQNGDVVLLSPGCASYDEFRDYHHRGQEFIRLTNLLPQRE